MSYRQKYEDATSSILIRLPGIRVSNYNAVSEAGVEKLVAYMKEFAAA
jgi:phosphoserine aminotransferase